MRRRADTPPSDAPRGRRRAPMGAPRSPGGGRTSDDDARGRPSAPDELKNYEKLGRIGEGTYGVVYKARCRATNEIVALKRVRMDRERDGMPLTSLREIKILQRCAHENVISLKRVIQGETPSNVFLVFEYCEHEMARLIDFVKTKFTTSEVKSLMMQTLRAVEYLHERKVFHRDLKLSNLLLNQRGELKLCDFGLARTYDPIEAGIYTPKVVTLWYRAPELLFGEEQYTAAIDMWSCGCVFAEFLKHAPLFPASTEIELMQMICALLGNPNSNIWPGWDSLPHAKSFKFPEQPYNFLELNFPSLSPAGVDLLDGLLTYDPGKRLTAKEALAHEYFKEMPPPKSPAEMPTFPSTHNTSSSRSRRAAEDNDRSKRQRGALDDRIAAVF